MDIASADGEKSYVSVQKTTDSLTVNTVLLAGVTQSAFTNGSKKTKKRNKVVGKTILFIISFLRYKKS